MAPGVPRSVPAPFLPPGYALVREVREGPGSRIQVVRTPGGSLAVFKLAWGGGPGAEASAAAWLEGVCQLSRQTGWLDILDAGLGPDPGAYWHVSPLADSLSGSVVVAGVSLPDDYVPGDLRHAGPLPAADVLEAGVRLCAALARLHDLGLVHRDIKPGNLLRIRGQVCLGDYDLIREASPGPVPSAGTEGYRPPEGGGTCAADIHALGKTLYQLWTGLDRLEFPSLPAGFGLVADWSQFGAHLNRVLLRACDPSPSARFPSMRAFGDALRAVADGGAAARLRLTRRVLRVGALAGLAVMVLLVVFGLGHRGDSRRLPDAAAPPQQDVGMRGPPAGPGQGPATDGSSP